jgi:tight adherence protein C
MLELLAQNPIARISLLVLLFSAVGTAAYAVVNWTSARRDLRRRLEPAGAPLPSVLAPGHSLRGDQTRSAWNRIIERVERSGLSLADTNDRELRQKLAAAGFNSPVAPRVYTLVRLILVVLLPALVLFVHWMAADGTGMIALYVQAMIAALLGLYVPALVVRAKGDRRRQALVNGFPDALDLMLVCVEAGLGLEAAFTKVGQEMVHSHPLIAEQLSQLVLELRAGRSREDALRRLADRAGVDEIRAFSTLLIQSTKLGSSVGQTLRIYAAEMREKRRMRAEEKAHRLPVLLSIPLVACMLPVMIGVLMLPAAIRVIRTIIPAMQGAS